MKQLQLNYFGQKRTDFVFSQSNLQYYLQHMQAMNTIPRQHQHLHLDQNLCTTLTFTYNINKSI
jgi:hypothetical protein